MVFVHKISPLKGARELAKEGDVISLIQYSFHDLGSNAEFTSPLPPFKGGIRKESIPLTPLRQGGIG